MKSCTILSLAIIVSLVMVATMVAEVPGVISYQGGLTTPAGSAALDGTYTVVFTICDAAFGGVSKWTETQLVTTSGGLFSVR